MFLYELIRLSHGMAKGEVFIVDIYIEKTARSIWRDSEQIEKVD